MTKKTENQTVERSIVLIPNQPPNLVGNWTVGEVQQMGNSLIQWVQSLPMGTPANTEIENVED